MLTGWVSIEFLTISISAMSYLDYIHDLQIIIDRIDYAIIAHPNSPQITFPRQFLTTIRTRFFTQ